MQRIKVQSPVLNIFLKTQPWYLWSGLKHKSMLSLEATSLQSEQDTIEEKVGFFACNIFPIKLH